MRHLFLIAAFLLMLAAARFRAGSAIAAAADRPG